MKSLKLLPWEIVAGLALVLTTLGAHGQNTFPASGSVGIGTTSPIGTLDVKLSTNQHINFVANVNTAFNGTPGILSINDAANAYTPMGFWAAQYFFGGGNVGIGTTNPQALLDVQPTTDGVTSLLLSQQNCVTCGWSMSAKDDGVFRLFRSDNPSSIFSMLYNNGNVGIGTASPAYKLDVSGSIRTTGGIVFPDGTAQTTAFNATLCGGDYAESVEAANDRAKYEPGDVLVISSDAKADVVKSAEPYSTLVAGIYSTKPGVTGRRQTSAKSPEELPMAMVGIVPTKVSAENGSIHRGDLLVSSSKPGYAMKGTDRSKMLGAVIGKAMGELNSGNGTIEVLVTLQ